MSTKVVIKPSNHEFHVEAGETLLDAALRSGLALDYGCTSGSCGKCKARVSGGEALEVRPHDYIIRDPEKLEGYVLLCSTTAATDLTVEAVEARGPEDIPSQKVSARVHSLNPIREGVMLLGLRTPRTQVLRFLAGQHVLLELDEQSTQDIAVASCPCDGMNLQFHLRYIEGHPFTERVFSGLRKGDTVRIRGPSGRFTLDESAGRPIIFLAYDTGFGAVRSLIEHAINAELELPMHLYWCVPHREGHYMENYCRSWMDALDAFRYTPLVGSEAIGAESAQRITDDYDDLAGSDVYVVAPLIFAKEAKRVFLQYGLPEERFFADEVAGSS